MVIFGLVIAVSLLNFSLYIISVKSLPRLKYLVSSFMLVNSSIIILTSGSLKNIMDPDLLYKLSLLTSIANYILIISITLVLCQTKVNDVIRALSIILLIFSVFMILKDWYKPTFSNSLLVYPLKEQIVFYYLLLAFYLSLTFLIVYAATIFQKSTSETAVKRRNIIFFISFTLIIFIKRIVSFAVITNTISLQGSFIINTFFAFILSFIIALALVHYKNFMYNPKFLANNILDTILDAVLLIDNKYNVRYVNTAAYKLLKYFPDELLGKSVKVVFGNDISRMKEINSIILQDDISNIETAITDKNGKEVSVLLSSSNMKDNYGHHMGIVCIIKDMSLIKISEDNLWKSEEHFRTLIENIPDVVYRSPDNTKWNFSFINDNIAQITGYEAKDFLENKIKFEDIILREDQGFVKRVVYDAIINHTGYEIDYRVVNKFGEIRWVHNKGKGIFDKKGNLISYDGVLSDITNRKTVERELNRINSKLSDQKEELQYIVHIRTLELQSAIAKMSENDEHATLNELLSNLAHEINTPLGMCVTSLSFIEEKGNEIKRAFYSECMRKTEFIEFMDIFNEFIKILTGNVNQALNLIRSFKQIAVDQSSDVKRNINLKGHIDEILLSLKPKIKKTKHRIDVNADQNIFIYTNPGALSQILTNLIMNSFIHGFENIESGIININAQIKEDMVKIEYRDNGAGIPDEYINKIYDMYFTTKKGRGGTGLGMSIVMDLVTRVLNGSIKVESEIGQYTVFYIEFPVQSKDPYKYE